MTRPTTTAISPFFIVSNVDQTIAFYRDKLDFETRFQEPDREPFFAIIGRDGAQIFVKSQKDVPHGQTPSVIPTCGWMPSSMPQTRTRSLPNLPSDLPTVGQHSACPFRIPTTVFAASRFATLTATSCSSVDPGSQRRSDSGAMSVTAVLAG